MRTIFIAALLVVVAGIGCGCNKNPDLKAKAALSAENRLLTDDAAKAVAAQDFDKAAQLILLIDDKASKASLEEGDSLRVASAEIKESMMQLAEKGNAKAKEAMMNMSRSRR